MSCLDFWGCYVKDIKNRPLSCLNQQTTQPEYPLLVDFLEPAHIGDDLACYSSWSRLLQPPLSLSVRAIDNDEYYDGSHGHLSQITSRFLLHNNCIPRSTCFVCVLESCFPFDKNSLWCEWNRSWLICNLIIWIISDV